MTLLSHGRKAGGMLAILSLAASVDAGSACAVPNGCTPYPNQCQPYSAELCPPGAPAPIPPDPGSTMPPVVQTPTAPAPMTPAPSAQMFQAQAASEAGLGELAFANAGAGYIDIAVPQTMFRLRYDAAFNGDFSMDRAEYMYPAYRTFAQNGGAGGVGGIGGVGGVGGVGGGAIGGNEATADVDLQEVHAYFEYAFNNRFSTFVNVPFRSVDTTLTNVTGIDAPSGGGLGDVWFGFKYALIATPDDYLTFQTKVYTPTGDEDDALGTGHTSIEPGLLFQSSLNPDITFFGEAKYWIPIDETEVPADATGDSGSYSSGVFQYGLGAAIDLVEQQTWKVQSVNEFVGWTAIDSLKGDPTVATLAQDASGDTVVNVKIGARFYRMCRGREQSSLYAGWGHALTDEMWYEDLFRLEYRVLF
ncbi:MAG: transporter [Planctomycetota bacterium]|nr:transporter [Planctomycetota bacterium]